jgi:hypothetical protein
MRTLGGLFVALLFAGGLSAQYRGNFQVSVTGGPGNAVFPGGTAANNPGLVRITPNVVYPGGGGPHLTVPGTTRKPRSAATGTSYLYAYPVYVPVYDPSAYADSAPDAAPPAAPSGQPAPTVIVVYPPPPAPAVETAHPSMQVLEPEPPQPAAETPAADYYLFAFKDHSIYSAVAYWVDGDTLHYFTSGDTHRQAPLSQLDRDLTERLNRESGVQLKLPPAPKP